MKTVRLNILYVVIIWKVENVVHCLVHTDKVATDSSMGKGKQMEALEN